MANCGCQSSPRDAQQPTLRQPADLFVEDAEPQVAALAFAEDQLLVRTLPGVEASDVAGAFAHAGVVPIERFAEIDATLVQVAPGELAQKAVALAGDPVIEAVQKNYLFDAQRTPDDPRFADQAPLQIIGLPEAWEITTGDDGLIIAVLDSGVAAGHVELADRLLPGRNTFDRTTTSSDVLGHGTMVAGVLGAASNNGKGVAGVNWAGRILPIRVTNAIGQASSSAIASGIIWATNRGARVINISFAPLQADGAILRAARYAYANGALVFISAGNDGRYSSSRGSREAVFVGATDTDNVLASFSTTGPFVDLCAPGVGVWSTAFDGDYRAASGTSFASPIAAGVGALVWAARLELRPATVERILRTTAVDLGDPGRDDAYGAGRIDAAAALSAALDLVETADTHAPLVAIAAPPDGALVEGLIHVSAQAEDLDGGTGVSDVTFYVDGKAIISDPASPYRIALQTEGLAPGGHTLSCVATDEVGNASAPASIRVQVGATGPEPGGSVQPADAVLPEAIIQFPIEGAIVSGPVGALATVTDNVELRSVDWLVDGLLHRAVAVRGTRASATFVWDASGAAAGAHTISVRVLDAAGNVGSASVAVLKQ